MPLYPLFAFKSQPLKPWNVEDNTVIKIDRYFGSRPYYEGELLKDERYKYDPDWKTLTVTLPDGDVKMWSCAIDARRVKADGDPLEELPQRGFDEKSGDCILFHYTDHEARAAKLMESLFSRCSTKLCHTVL
eukprot:Skav215679  [mRNA]  locus=scaffold278:141583:141978:- [translate_table: standard]